MLILDVGFSAFSATYSAADVFMSIKIQSWMAIM